MLSRAVMSVMALLFLGTTVRKEDGRTLRAPPAPREPVVSEPERPRGDSCVGRWGGAGSNHGPEWTIDMTVERENGQGCGRIEYPSLGCGGYLTQCVRRGDTVTFTEVYTHNPGTCAPAGRIEARCGHGVMSWRWSGWEVVHTTLYRR